MDDYFLRSQRLGFRCWRDTDLALAINLWGDPTVTRYITSRGYTLREVQIRLELEIEAQHAHRIRTILHTCPPATRLRLPNALSPGAILPLRLRTGASAPSSCFRRTTRGHAFVRRFGISRAHYHRAGGPRNSACASPQSRPAT